MDIIKFYQDYNIPYWTAGKNVSTGWVNVQCPYCDDQSNHLGYNLTTRSAGFYCWRCGSHPFIKTVSRLLCVDESEAISIVKDYGARHKAHKKIEEQLAYGYKDFSFPSGIMKLRQRHKDYLIKRNFDPEHLVREWNLIGTGPTSQLDSIDYKFRIIAPIYWEDRIVSFQARDITNRSKRRYIVCPKAREIIHHKYIIYGNFDRHFEVGIAVEGITDVWRLGPMAFATFGIEYTPIQIKTISQLFERVMIFFDSEPQAQKQAEKLLQSLRFMNVRTHRMMIDNDPASMSQDDANNLVKNISKWR